MHLMIFGVLGQFITLYVLRFFSYSYEIYIWRNTKIDPTIYNFKKRTLLRSLLILFEVLIFLFIIVYANFKDLNIIQKTLICAIKLYVNYSEIVYDVLMKIFLILFIQAAITFIVMVLYYLLIIMLYIYARSSGELEPENTQEYFD